MNRSFVCSPFRGNTRANRLIATLLGGWLFRGNIIPIVPHVFFTDMLDDAVQAERDLGIKAGHALMAGCQTLILEVARPSLQGITSHTVFPLDPKHPKRLTCIVCEGELLELEGYDSPTDEEILLFRKSHRPCLENPLSHDHPAYVGVRP